MLRRTIGPALPLFAIAATLSCGGGQPVAPGAPVAISSLSVTAASGFTGLNQMVQLTATAMLSTGATQDVTSLVTWQSFNAAVLSVSSSGLATSIAEGTAKVTATYQSVAASSDVVVKIQWSVQGRVVSNPDGAAVSGAMIAIDGAMAATSGAGGTYALLGPGQPASTAVTVSADGFLTRSTTLGTGGARSGVALDLISLKSPFSLSFYQELVRGAEDHRGAPLLQNFRWETSPSFYIRTSNGSREMPPEVISELQGLIPTIVAQVSAGRFSVSRIESGSTDRPIVAGWINVEYTSSISSCGLATVGGNRVQINPLCSCLGTVGAHEITHAMGFWHHSRPGGLMSHVAPSQCVPSLSSLEAYHTAIAYSRPRGNLDPDTDPHSAAPLRTAGATADRTLACGAIR